MLLRVAAAVAMALLIMGNAPLPAVADEHDTVTISVDMVVGKAAQGLAGTTWNTGDLGMLGPFSPAYVRTGLRLGEVSPREGVLELDDVVDRVETIFRAGSRPLILVDQVPPWLARSVPSGCRQIRRAQPCPPTAMAPTDLSVWEDLIEDVVGRLADRFDRDLAFELWNEPDNTNWWADTESRFIDTAMAMHRAIARVEVRTGLDMSVGGVALGDVGPLLKRYREAAVSQGTPPDFISWHDYTRDPLDYRRDVAEVRNLIADPSIPLAITEWNHYGRKGNERNTAEGAAFNLASLIEMERAGVRQASFYRSVSFGRKPSDAGLVTGTGRPRPSWWILQLWRSLEGDRLFVSGDDTLGGLWARATRNGNQVDVILSSYAEKRSLAHDVALNLSGTCDASTATVRTINRRSSGFGSKREVDLDSLTVPMASPASVWVSIDCSGAERATQIEPHSEAPVQEEDGRASEQDGSSWIAWAGIGLVTLLLAAYGRRLLVRRRARTDSSDGGPAA